MRIFYTFSEVIKIIESYDSLEYFGWRTRLLNAKDRFIPLPTKFISRDYYEELLASLRKINNYSTGPNYVSDFFRQINKFLLTLVVFLNSGRRFAPVKDTEFLSNQYGFYDLFITPLGIFFSFRKEILLGGLLKLMVYSILLPYAVFVAFLFNTFIRPPLYFLLVWLPGTLRSFFPFLKYFIFFPIDSHWSFIFRLILKGSNYQILYAKPYKRRYYDVPFITLFFIKQHRLTSRYSRLRLKRFLGYRTSYELTLSDKDLCDFYLHRSNLSFLNRHKLSILEREFREAAEKDFSSSGATGYPLSVVKSTFSPRFARYILNFFNAGHYSASRFFSLLLSTKKLSKPLFYGDESEYVQRRFWLRSNFIKSELDDVIFMHYFWVGFKNLFKLLFFYIPFLVLFPFLKSLGPLKFSVVPRLPSFKFRVHPALRKFRNPFKLFLLTLLQLYSFLIFVNYVLGKFFGSISSYMVARYHFVYFDMFRRYFIASKFYRFFTREIDEALEDEKPSWEEEYLEEDSSSNEQEESESEATNAEAQAFESGEVSYEDTDVFGNSIYFGEESQENSERKSAHSEDLKDTAIDYDFFDSSINHDEDYFLWSLFAFWEDDAINDVGSRSIDQNIKLEEDNYDKEELEKDPNYEESYFSVYNYVLPTENVRPAAVKTAYEYNKYVQAWYDKNRNSKFIKVPGLFFPSGRCRDLEAPISFEEWRKLTVCVLPFLSKAFDPNKLITPASLKLVWDRLDYEMVVNPKSIWQKFNAEDFAAQASVDEIFTQFSRSREIHTKFLEFFFGRAITEKFSTSLFYRAASILRSYVQKKFTVDTNTEMFYFCYIATLQANKDFPTFFRLYQSQLAHDPRSNWIFDFLIYKAKYDVSDATVYRMVVPAELEVHTHDEEAYPRYMKDPTNSKDSIYRYTDRLTYQAVLVNFLYDIAATFTGNGGKHIDFTSPDTTKSDPYFNLMRGNEYTPQTPGVIPDINPPAEKEKLAGWNFLIPFYAKIIDAFYDPYINTIYFPGTFTEISEDFISLDDEEAEDDLDAYDEYIFINELPGMDEAINTIPDNPNSLYLDDPEAEDFIDPDDNLNAISDEGEENTLQSVHDSDFTYLYDGDLELYIWENTDNQEEWEYDEFSSYEDVSQPLSRLFFGSLRVDRSSFPATDPRVFIGPLSEHKGDTDPAYTANFKRIRANASCKALVPYTRMYAETRPPVISQTLKPKSLTASDPKKRFLYRLVANLIRTFRFVSIWMTQIYIEFEFYKSDFSVFSKPGKSIALYLHYKKHSHIYDNTINKRHARFVKSWIKDFENIFDSFGSIKKAEKLNFYKKSTESKFHFFKDPFGRFWYQQPFVNDMYATKMSKPDDEENAGSNEEISYEEVYEESFEEIFVDYLDGRTLSKDHLFDLYDKSRFASLDELELTNLTGIDDEDQLANSDPMTLSDNELEWDWGTMVGYSSDEDIYHKASEFVNVYDVVISALSDYFWLVLDYTLYLIRLLGAFHVIGRYHYWSEVADTWWLKIAFKYGRWVYFFRYGTATSFFITICIYSYFVIPRIVYLFSYGVNSYFFTVFAHSFISLLIFVFCGFFLFRPFYDLYKSMSMVERESFWLYIVMVWFFYIYYGYVSAPWTHFTAESNVHKISNLSIEPDNHFYPRSHYVWPHVNKTLESQRVVTIYDTLEDRRPTMVGSDIEPDKIRFVFSFSYSKAPLTFSTLYNIFTHHILGVQNNFIVGYKYIYRTINTPISRPVEQLGYEYVHHLHYMNFGGLTGKMKNIVKEGNWAQFMEFSQAGSLYQYNYHLSDRTFRNSRVRSNHIMGSEHNLPQVKSIVFYPYEARTKELDFQYDKLYPVGYRMYSFSRRYHDGLATNNSSVHAPRNRIRYTRFSSKFNKKSARVKLLQYKVYNHSLWDRRRRYLSRVYQRPLPTQPGQIEVLYQLAAKDNWYKREITKIGSALSFSDNFIFFLYSHYPTLRGLAKELKVAPKKSFYASRGHPDPLTKQLDRRITGSKYRVYNQYAYPVTHSDPDAVPEKDVFDLYADKPPEDTDGTYLYEEFIKNFHLIRYHSSPHPPRVSLGAADRAWFVSKARKLRQLHHFINHLIITNKFYNHNYYIRNFVPYLTDNPHHKAYSYSKYLAYESGIRKEKGLGKDVYDAYYENPIVRKYVGDHFKGFFKSPKKIFARYPGAHYDVISNVKRDQRGKFSPRRIYGWKRRYGKRLDRRFIRSTYHRFQEPYNDISQYGGGIQSRFFAHVGKRDRKFLSKYAHYNRRMDPTLQRMKDLVTYEKGLMKGVGVLNVDWYDPTFPLNETLHNVLCMCVGFRKENPVFKNGYFTRPTRHTYFENFLLERAFYMGYKNVYFLADNIHMRQTYPRRLSIYDEILSRVYVGNYNTIMTVGSKKKLFGSPLVKMMPLLGLDEDEAPFNPEHYVLLDDNSKIKASYHSLLGRRHRFWRYGPRMKATRSTRAVRRALWHYKLALDKRLKFLADRKKSKKKLITPNRLKKWSQEIDERSKDPRRNRGKATGFDLMYYDQAIAKRDKNKRTYQPGILSQLGGSTKLFSRSLLVPMGSSNLPMDELKGDRQIVAERERRRVIDQARKLHSAKKSKKNEKPKTNITKGGPDTEKSSKASGWFSWIFGRKSS